MSPTLTYDEGMAQVYSKRPDMAADILNSVLEDGDLQHIRLLLKQLTNAYPERIRSSIGDEREVEQEPGISNLLAVAGALNMRLAVIPVEQVFEEQAEAAQVDSTFHTPSADPVHS